MKEKRTDVEERDRAGRNSACHLVTSSGFSPGEKRWNAYKSG